MIADLHNHTVLCNHAKDSMEEYILQAIKNKTKFFGFSDHAPMKFDEEYRMKFEDMKKYEQDVLKLKDIFKDKIDILLGYEVDFLPNFMQDCVLQSKCDYLIGSVHFLDSWGFDNPEYIGEYKNKNIDEIYEKYFLSIENMAKSGLFDIVGHIDLIKVFNFKPTKDIKILSQNALKAIKKADMVVELNLSGYRKPVNELYPSDEILKQMAELDIPITFGSDAHAKNQVGLNSERAVAKAKKFGYTKAAIFKNRDRNFVEF
ncbi:MAG: histidinol-phosphatase [Campylobacter sputorum]|uniref:histidinol-phosphatase n=1 Tax=Campylobacter sputorum TaxID=206 RepID=UPI000B7776CF|nr:histidinol-phosphatase [Campylobacter sputorum]ASM38805.1 histidinol-phosphate phosphatase [Campylobacter sputorum bv. paraureolyticus LMG 11764]MDY6120543.1 histidinol-phosphatase [Campylobacter sputorum]